MIMKSCLSCFWRFWWSFVYLQFKFQTKATSVMLHVSKLRIERFNVYDLKSWKMTCSFLFSRSDVAMRVEYSRFHTERKKPDIKMYSTDRFMFEMHKVKTEDTQQPASYDVHILSFSWLLMSTHLSDQKLNINVAPLKYSSSGI